MKTRRNIYIGIGSILILLNVLVDIISFTEYTPESTGVGFSIGYFIGSHFLLIFGVILLRLAYRLNKRIKSREELTLDKSIDEIGAGNNVNNNSNQEVAG